MPKPPQNPYIHPTSFAEQVELPPYLTTTFLAHAFVDTHWVVLILFFAVGFATTQPIMSNIVANAYRYSEMFNSTILDETKSVIKNGSWNIGNKTLLVTTKTTNTQNIIHQWLPIVFTYLWLMPVIFRLTRNNFYNPPTCTTKILIRKLCIVGLLGVFQQTFSNSCSISVIFYYVTIYMVAEITTEWYILSRYFQKKYGIALIFGMLAAVIITPTFAIAIYYMGFYNISIGIFGTTLSTTIFASALVHVAHQTSYYRAVMLRSSSGTAEIWPPQTQPQTPRQRQTHIAGYHHQILVVSNLLVFVMFLMILTPSCQLSVSLRRPTAAGNTLLIFVMYIFAFIFGKHLPIVVGCGQTTPYKTLLIAIQIYTKLAWCCVFFLFKNHIVELSEDHRTIIITSQTYFVILLFVVGFWTGVLHRALWVLDGYSESSDFEADMILYIQKISLEKLTTVIAGVVGASLFKICVIRNDWVFSL